jgi:hypothetical protein
LVDGAVFRPPFRGTRAFLEWAVGLWPYVNGKALMNGIDLKELDASDMIDIIHYLFEEDMKVASKEEMDAISEVRKVVYEEFYSTSYFLAKTSSKYSTPNASGNFSEESFETITPFDPNIKNASKKYIPPTQFDPESVKPFGDILDGPIN